MPKKSKSDIEKDPITKDQLVSRSKKADLVERRENVQRARLRGYPPSTIATMLGMSQSAVLSDLEQSAVDAKEKFLAKDRDDFMAEIWAKWEEIEREAWKDHYVAKTNAERTRSSDLIRKIQKDKTDALQAVGILRGAQQTTVVHHHLNWDKELKDAVAESIVETKLTPQLEGSISLADLDAIIDVEVVEDDND